MTHALPELVEDLFRHRYGRMVTGLVRALGPARLDLAEDVVQEALLRALRTWPVSGVPDQPDAWVFRTARNLALDVLRRRAVADRAEDELRHWARDEPPEPAAATGEAHRIADDTLRMMFTCCHPAVPPETRVPLVLKTTGGFGVPEIAAALLTKPGTIAQRLTRGKARLTELDVQFEMPGAEELPARLPLLLEVLYLMFNEGYRTHRGRELVRRDLVDEALRLCALLLSEPRTRVPAVHALLAQMLLLGARLPARTDELGELLTLAEQDRSKWDRDWLRCGFYHLRESIGGPVLTTYHVEAAIASIHAAAPSYDATDWPRLLGEYDRLLLLHDSSIVRLNRTVVIAKVHGAQRALAELDHLEPTALDNYFLLPATRAHLHWQLGQRPDACAALERALQLPCSEPERRLLERRLQNCRAGAPPPTW